MKPEDEIFLSAYLDGELDPDERSRVESAVLSDPALGERLRQLGAVGDLVASLPRPALRADLTPAVLGRIRRRGAWALGPATAGAPRLLAGLAAAALIVLAGTTGLHLGLWSRPDHHPAIVPVAVVSPRPAAPAAVAERPASSPREAVAVSLPSAAAPSARATAPGVAASRVDEAELRKDRERLRIRDLLDSPNLTRILIVVDELGGKAGDRVETLVRRTPRIDSDFGRITVGQGILIDPRYPGEAKVFAMVMDDDELRRFKGELDQEFPDSVEEVDPEPSVVTRLSGIGQVAVLAGTPATDLHTPPATASTPLTALRESPRPAADVMLPDGGEFPGRQVKVTGPVVSPAGNPSEAHTDPERELSGPLRGHRGPPDAPASGALAKSGPATGRDAPRDPAEARPARGREPSIVLVWVTSRERPPSGRN